MFKLVILVCMQMSWSDLLQEVKKYVSVKAVHSLEHRLPCEELFPEQLSYNLGSNKTLLL